MEHLNALNLRLHYSKQLLNIVKSFRCKLSVWARQLFLSTAVVNKVKPECHLKDYAHLFLVTLADVCRCFFSLMKINYCNLIPI